MALLRPCSQVFALLLILISETALAQENRDLTSLSVDRSHREFSGPADAAASAPVNRNVYGKVTWRF